MHCKPETYEMNFVAPVIAGSFLRVSPPEYVHSRASERIRSGTSKAISCAIILMRIWGEEGYYVCQGSPFKLYSAQ